MTNGQIETMPTGANNGTTGTGNNNGPTPDQLAAGLRGTEMALAATVVVTQIQNSFSGFANKGFAQAALTAAPLLLLNPASQGSGLVGILTSPKVLGIAAVAGLAIAKDMSNPAAKSTSAVRLVLDNRMEQKLVLGSRYKFLVDVFDERGKATPGENIITFASSAPHILKVDPDGVVEALEPGIATITASIDDKSDLVTVQVTPLSEGPEVRHRDTRNT